MIVYLVYMGAVFVTAASMALSQMHRVGIGSPAYYEVRSLQERAEQHRGLSAADMNALRRLSNDKYWIVRCRALASLFYVGGTPQAGLAASIARAKLNDPVPVVRVYALSALSRLHAPDVKQIARKMLADSDKDVRKRAQIVITQGK
ncbi:MAG TPA: HEAT repeat domain-containing protein [Chthonomonadaceae bacterium]|nr:HEAT repeat domain-containing protein [Chthonomonadaceae bacterium]